MVSEVPATVWEGALADAGRARRPIFGVGYGGRSIGEITDLLGEMRIDEVADVRLNPWSPRPEYRPKALAQRLMDDAGIGYTHYPALGNPYDNRAMLTSNDPLRRAEGAQRYAEKVLDSEPGDYALGELADTATCRRVAVLCACRGGDRCHRRLVLARLSARYSFVEAEL